jgi:catechol 2,3-dioxygenase-like lactoylglutathione lyase family enzyme
MATFDLIGIIVEDMAASLAFYRKLGLDIPAEADGEDHVEVELRGGMRLAWDDAAMIASYDPPTEVARGHKIGLAFKCEDAAEVDSLYADLIAAGYKSHKPPWDAFWGQRYAVICDPDDNHIELFA